MLTELADGLPVPANNRGPSKAPWYYQFIISLLKPLYRVQVWRRSHKRDNYQQEVNQRFGKHYPSPPLAAVNKNQLNKNNIHLKHQLKHQLKSKRIIWCHAVSLGETNTVAPLLDALLQNGYQIWLTNTTQTGFARGASRFAEQIAQGRMSHSYVPVDSPAVIARFLAHVQPIAALFVETELWANILTKLACQNIPSILVNGRLSAASFNRYQKISAVSSSMMQNLSLIIAQDDESAKRFRQLGAYSAQIRVAGSLKWVINTPKITNTEQADAKLSAQDNSVKAEANIDLAAVKRPIWVAASTHSGEEEVALSWQQQLLAEPKLKLNPPLLIIVPRHPERFDEVAELIEPSGLQLARRSKNDAISAQTQVYLADSMGELMQWYTLAAVALVGGSLSDIGGHNPVEPASVCTPVLMGPYTQSCQTVVDKLASVGALYQPNNRFYHAVSIDAKQSQASAVSDINDLNNISDVNAALYQQLQFWLSHAQIAKLAGQAGAQLTQQQQTVLSSQLMMIESVIKQSLALNK